jgi:hypothetical protein
VGFFVPLVPIAVEVDPETPTPAVRFRLPAAVPSLLGLPLRLDPTVPSLTVPCVVVAFDSIQLARWAPVPRMRHPVIVTCCELRAEALERVEGVVPLVPRRVVSV